MAGIPPDWRECVIARMSITGGVLVALIRGVKADVTRRNRLGVAPAKVAVARPVKMRAAVKAKALDKVMK